MATAGYAYEISINLRRGRNGAPPDVPASLRFEHVNHDEIIGIVERVRQTSGLSPDAAASTAVGLKLLSEVNAAGEG